jgi:hypothetical protein
MVVTGGVAAGIREADTGADTIMHRTAMPVAPTTVMLEAPITAQPVVFMAPEAVTPAAAGTIKPQRNL